MNKIAIRMKFLVLTARFFIKTSMAITWLNGKLNKLAVASTGMAEKYIKEIERLTQVQRFENEKLEQQKQQLRADLGILHESGNHKN